LEQLEILHVLPLTVENLANDESTLVRRTRLSGSRFGLSGGREEDALFVEKVDELGDSMNDLWLESMSREGGRGEEEGEERTFTTPFVSFPYNSFTANKSLSGHFKSCLHAIMKCAAPR
jgi:hypothetical protein